MSSGIKGGSKKEGVTCRFCRGSFSVEVPAWVYFTGYNAECPHCRSTYRLKANQLLYGNATDGRVFPPRVVWPINQSA